MIDIVAIRSEGRDNSFTVTVERKAPYENHTTIFVGVNFDVKGEPTCVFSKEFDNPITALDFLREAAGSIGVNIDSDVA